jgi:hypothetical protein
MACRLRLPHPNEGFAAAPTTGSPDRSIKEKEEQYDNQTIN